MVIQMDRPLANDHPEGPATNHSDQPDASNKHHLLLENISSSNLEDQGSISRTFLEQCVLVYKQNAGTPRLDSKPKNLTHSKGLGTFTHLVKEVGG